jgi:hypothetical protein
MMFATNNKVSIVSTKDTNIIVGVASHDKNIHDSKTLTVAISHANRNKPIKQAVCDRGYVGANIILPKKALKRDNRYRPLKTTPNKPTPPFFQPSKSTKLLFIQYHKKP